MGHPQLNFLGDFDLFKPYEVSFVLLSYLVRHPRVSAFILCIRDSIDVLTCWCSLLIFQWCMDFALGLIVERDLIYFTTRGVNEAFGALGSAVKFQSKANDEVSINLSPQNTSPGSCYATTPTGHRQDWEWKQRCADETWSQRADGNDQHRSFNTRFCSCHINTAQWIFMGRQVLKLHCRSHRNDVEFHRTLSVFCQEKTRQKLGKILPKTAFKTLPASIDSRWWMTLDNWL